MFWILLGIFLFALISIAVYDLVQKRHAILRNFPVIGHARYLLEKIGPELRQYFFSANDEERPFTRDERSWVYASSKKQNNYFGFGTDNDLELTSNTLIIKHSAFPVGEPRPGDDDYDPEYAIPCAKVLGQHRQRKHAFRPASIVNLSAMSFGSLSSAATIAINRGCKIAGCLHNTGEGGIAPYHDQGGELIYQLGTGYFGARGDDGRFDLKRFEDTVASHQVKAIEVKLSQGAKPGRGGVLPAKKITAEISRIRGIPMGADCISPAAHLAFHNADSLLDFVEELADATGLPVGIKSAVGLMDFWRELADQMTRSKRGVDFIAIDGGEGGTGAAPLVFSDHVSLPFKLAFSRVYKIFFEAGIHEQVLFMGAGKLGFPESTLFAFALGCDAVYVAREAMMAIGCIQAQKCHTGHCPTGVATQQKWFVRGLDPTDKSARLANYLITLRKEVLQLCRACGVPHPALITPDHLEIIHPDYQTSSLGDCFQLAAGAGLPSAEDIAFISNSK